jgi:hypothetical protein
MQDRSEKLRSFFARYVAARGGARDYRIEQAFAAVPRERFVGPGPWSINLPGRGYVRTPNDDPAYIYQDTLVAIDTGRGDAPDASCWCQGDGWWLSTAPAIDPRVLDRHVGRYRLSPDFILPVRRDADRLFVQATGQDRYEFVAEGERVYRCDAVDARITFETDGAGRAVRLVLHQHGKDMVGDRIIEA